jgi:hypothetical protein
VITITVFWETQCWPSIIHRGIGGAVFVQVIPKIGLKDSWRWEK